MWQYIKEKKDKVADNNNPTTRVLLNFFARLIFLLLEITICKIAKQKDNHSEKFPKDAAINIDYYYLYIILAKNYGGVIMSIRLVALVVDIFWSCSMFFIGFGG